MAAQVCPLPGALELSYLSKTGVPYTIATRIAVGSPRGAPARSASRLLSGGYGHDELEQVGAYRFYQDPADLLEYLDEMEVRTTE